MNKYIVDFMKERMPGISFPLADFLDRQKFNRTKKEYDDSKINWIKNCAKKKRCFIVATGPSLTIDDVNALAKEDTFGVNSICKLFDRTSWRPTFYCLSDKMVYQSLKNDLEKWQPSNIFYSKKEFECTLKHAIPVLCRAAYPLYQHSKLKTEKILFSDDATKCVYTCATVVFFTLQLAVTMGYKQIYLLGTDCNYTGSQLHSSLTAYNASVNPDVGLSMFRPYEEAKRYADKHGIEIYNASRGGLLEVFPRVVLDKVLKD